MITEHSKLLLHKQSNIQIIIFALALLFALPAITVAQENESSRPKLGLALSGGGAKGLAHIGVIKVMEEAGLHPDYITGVSMGSIVGGLYAMGYSPDSIATIFRTFDWNLALSDRIPENKVIFLEKKHYNNSMISLPITRNSIKLPSGLINGQQIEGGLNYFFWPSARINDFSKLPIPFLCLATDVVTSKKVVLKNGYLADAIRASMAIPSVFTAIKTDTAILVDGGVVRNFAVSELRDMGADIVIGSYVSFRGSSEQDLESAYGILKQIGFLGSLADYESQKRQTDIMIEPDMKDVQTLAFSETDSIIEKGYRYALKYKDRFKRLADSLNSLGPQQPLKPLPAVDAYQFDAIEVTGNKLIKDDQIIGVLEIQPGQPVGRDLLAEKIELLYGKMWFEKVKYRILPRNDSLILQISCIEKPKAMLYGSVHYDPYLNSGVILNFSLRDLFTSRSVINLESFIGQYYRVRIGAMQFVDKSQKFGCEAFFYADNTLLPLVNLRDETGQIINQNFITGLELSKRLGLNHLMSLTATVENQHLLPNYITATDIRRITYNYLKLSYSYEANSLDYKHFPNRGIIYDIRASSSKLFRGLVKTNAGRDVYDPGDEAPFSFDRFYTAEAHFKTYASPSEKITFSFGGDILFSTNVDSITSNNNCHYLGGIDAITDYSIPCIGFHANQISVKNLAGVIFGTDIEIADGLHLSFEGNIFAIQEPDRDEGLSLLGGYSIGAGYMTVAGPIRVGIMHGIYNREIFYKPVKGYVSIGFSF